MSQTDDVQDDAEMYKNQKVLRDLLVDQGMTLSEAGEELGVCASTVSRWARKHGIGDNIPDPDVEIPDTDEAYKDADLLEELYISESLSTVEISHLLDCSGNTVRSWLRKHGIEIRSRQEAGEVAKGIDQTDIAYYTIPRGHVYIRSWESLYEVHRLLAMSEWGVDAVVDNHVHHKNGVPWDNRVENLQLVSNAEHQQQHRKFKGIDRIRVAELYENGDSSIRGLASKIDLEISPTTVLNIHNEFYGGAS